MATAFFVCSPLVVVSPQSCEDTTNSVRTTKFGSQTLNFIDKNYIFFIINKTKQNFANILIKKENVKQQHGAISHLQVPLTLSFKVKLSAKFLLW